MKADEPDHNPEPLWPGLAPCPDGQANGEQPTYARYLLQSGKPSACVIVLPGGAYRLKAPHEAEPIALWLNSLGVSAVVVSYRTLPHRHPVPFLDATRAVRLVRCHAREWRIRPDRIGLLGFSAGGHLAATVGTQFDAGKPDDPDPVERVSSRPDALILCYPVISLEECTHGETLVNLLGENPPHPLREALSNEKRVAAETPPTFLWHTSDDDAVPLRNSLLFADALRRHQVPVELHVFPHGAHGLGLADDDPVVGQWKQLCRTWLRKEDFL
jgi:acetyl esterase/lipase